MVIGVTAKTGAQSGSLLRLRERCTGGPEVLQNMRARGPASASASSRSWTTGGGHDFPSPDQRQGIRQFRLWSFRFAFPLAILAILFGHIFVSDTR
jgi:hypothetical protein